MKSRYLILLGLTLSLILGISVKGFSYKLTGYQWLSSSATFYTKNSNNPVFNDAFRAALAQWNNLSDFTFYAIDSYDNACEKVSPRRNSWTFQYDICGIAFGSTTLAVAGTW